jgi:hypothetical protein
MKNSMVTLTQKQNFFFLFGLSALMWLTRGHHLASLAQLPDASWAIFFVIGFYFSSFAIIAFFLVQAAIIDYLVVYHLGIGQSCFTLAYGFLLPAYLSLWIAGKWLAKHYAINLSGLKNLFLAAVLSIVTCELISSGSYYFMNVPTNASIGEFMTRVLGYLPFALEITLAYLSVALVMHLLVFVFPQKQVLSQK